MDFSDASLWILRTEQPLHGCAPPYVGNGRLGVRLGALILGTDRAAPALTSGLAETCLPGTPRFDHSYPLQFFAAHARDSYQVCLPSWANIDLTVGEHRFEPQTAGTSSTRPLTTWLDMRTGEAGLDGAWRAGRDAIGMRIRMLLPRSHPHVGVWELELDDLLGPAELRFGLTGSHLVHEMAQTYAVRPGEISGEITTKKLSRKLAIGLRYEVDGADRHTVASDLSDSLAPKVIIRSSGKSLRVKVFFGIVGGTEPGDSNALAATLDSAQEASRAGTLRESNAALWKALWAEALDPTGLPLSTIDQKFVLAQQFYLLASYDGAANPTGPLGLCGNQWGGQMLWDTDLWHFRALNALWPRLAQQIIRARLHMLPAGRAYAKTLGFRGAWFGWMCDEEGHEQAPGHYQIEIHINAWIGLAVWESMRRMGDAAWDAEAAPLLFAIADAVCDRVTRDADGSYHLRGVLPPDESVVENPTNPGHCDDSVATNAAFATMLRAAVAAAGKMKAPANPQWKLVAENLFLQAPGANQIIPEYTGYTGHSIKQADAILLFYPLNLAYPADVVLANINYYRERVTWGPLMTEQVDACIRLRDGFGDRAAVLADFLTRYRRYVRGAFEVPYECIDQSNSIMLTACGGLLQTLIFGWFGADWETLGKVPRVEAGWSAI